MVENGNMRNERSHFGCKLCLRCGKEHYYQYDN
jgi:hypothetical protein